MQTPKSGFNSSKACFCTSEPCLVDWLKWIVIDYQLESLVIPHYLLCRLSQAQLRRVLTLFQQILDNRLWLHHRYRLPFLICFLVGTGQMGINWSMIMLTYLNLNCLICPPPPPSNTHAGFSTSIWQFQGIFLQLQPLSRWLVKMNTNWLLADLANYHYLLFTMQAIIGSIVERADTIPKNSQQVLVQ